MDFEKLYCLSTIGKRTALHVEATTDIHDSYALYRAEWSPQSPIVFKAKEGASGSRALDFISTTDVAPKLVSDRVVAILRPFTGWETYPVIVHGKDGKVIKGYAGLAVTGRCGPIDDTKSRQITEPPIVPQGLPRKRWLGLYFDLTSWDGSDLFVPEGTGLTVATEAVKVAMGRAEISNVQFTSLTEAENMSSALLFGESK